MGRAYRSSRKKYPKVEDLVYERDLQDTIRAAAQLHKWPCCYHTYDSRRSESGFPDLVIVGYGQLIIWELKREGECPTDAQTRWLKELSDVTAPPLVDVVRPGDLDTSLDILKKKGKA